MLLGLSWLLTTQVFPRRRNLNRNITSLNIIHGLQLPLDHLWLSGLCISKPNTDFFKRIVRQTRSFRNILMTMARKHQSIITYHIHDANVKRPTLSMSRMTLVAVEVLKDSITWPFAMKFPKAVDVNMTNEVTILGTSYCVGMLLPSGSAG